MHQLSGRIAFSKRAHGGLMKHAAWASLCYDVQMLVYDALRVPCCAVLLLSCAALCCCRAVLCVQRTSWQSSSWKNRLRLLLAFLLLLLPSKPAASSCVSAAGSLPAAANAVLLGAVAGMQAAWNQRRQPCGNTR
jgi:hypothetical protein